MSQDAPSEASFVQLPVSELSANLQQNAGSLCVLAHCRSYAEGGVASKSHFRAILLSTVNGTDVSSHAPSKPPSKVPSVNDEIVSGAPGSAEGPV